MIRLSRTESALFIGLIAVASVPLLYLFRHVDNNTLASWQWILNRENIGSIFFFLLPAVPVSLFLSQKDFYTRNAPFWLFILSFVSSGSLWGEPELILDSSRYFLQAKHVSEYGAIYFLRQWGVGIEAWTDMPLIPFVYGILFKVFGESRIIIQLFNSITFSITSILTFSIAQLYMDKVSAFCAGAFLAAMPYLLTQVPLLLVDIHTQFFLCLALYTFLKALRKGGVMHGVIAAVIITLALFTKYSTWSMLLLLPLMAAVSNQIELKRRFARVTLIFILTLILSGLFLIPKFQVVMGQITILREYQRPALKVWQEGVLSTLLFQIQPFISVFAAFGLVKAVRQRNMQLVVLGIFTLLFISLVQRIRYIIPLLPFLAILAANGLRVLRFEETRKFVCLTSFCFTLIFLHRAYLPFFHHTGMENIKDAGAYIDSLDVEMVRVCTLPQPKSSTPTFVTIPQLDLFTQKSKIIPVNWPSSVKSPQGYQPLLFAWKMHKPLFYPSMDSDDSIHTPLVVISGAPLDEEERSLLINNTALLNPQYFNADTKVFRFKTFVSVFH